MHQMAGNRFTYLAGFILLAFFSLLMVNGCDDSGVVNNEPETIPNPNVRFIDSLEVQEFMDSTSLVGLNLFNLTTVTRDSGTFSKDAQLIDLNSTGMNFYLRSGDMSILSVPIGAETKFNRIFGNFSPSDFDTISVIDVGRDTILPEIDFQWSQTDVKGSYFNDPLIDTTVYTFWLKGKSLNFHGRNIYGIIQARESSDNNPGNVGGFRMSFRVRINFNGENDFRKEIPNPNYNN
jgi:hypothetical protein